MPDHLVAELKLTLASLGSAVHMLRRQDADAAAVAFVCGGAEQRLREVLAALEPAPRPAGKRVLIADPERTWTGALAQALSEKGHEVRAATSADEALAKTDAGFEPDVVLLDIAMSQLSTLDVLRNPKHRPLMIAVTTWSRVSDRRLASAAGFDLFLRKPVAADAVARLVSTVR
jgi:CheY-like chemotaxis protein